MVSLTYFSVAILLYVRSLDLQQAQQFSRPQSKGFTSDLKGEDFVFISRRNLASQAVCVQRIGK